MICRAYPQIDPNLKNFFDWFNTRPLVQRRQKQVENWLAGNEQSIPVPDLLISSFPDDFRSQLRNAYSSKCVYCEQLINSDVEVCFNLYRPPFDARQDEDDEGDGFPDCYKWLRWDVFNFRLTCVDCAVEKKTRFPIAGDRASKGDYGDALRKEQPLIIDPLDININPLCHLLFDGSTGKVRAKEIRGKTSEHGNKTIWALGLNREKLVTARKMVASELRSKWETLVSSREMFAADSAFRILSELRECCSDNALFAGMNRQLLWGWSKEGYLPKINGWRSFQRELRVWNTEYKKRPISKNSIDFVLVTALKEERDAILAFIPEYRRVARYNDDINTYYEAILPNRRNNEFDSVYKIIICQMTSMGRVSAAIATKDVIRKWNPRYIVLVGIAGGIAQRDVNRGDLLISTQVVDYEVAKIMDDRSEFRWEVFQADKFLCNFAQNLGDDWKTRVAIERPGVGLPKCHFGPVASGDKVIADEHTLEQLRAHWPALIGVEMEAAGVAAAILSSVAPTPFFQVRGVSDLADANKQDDAWRSYACAVATAYVIALLESGPISTSGEKANRYT